MPKKRVTKKPKKSSKSSGKFSKKATDEVIDFMINLSGDAKQREMFVQDRKTFLKNAKLSPTARTILNSADQKQLNLALRRGDIQKTFVTVWAIEAIYVSVITTPDF